MFRTLHPISTWMTFGWRKAEGILVKWKNCLKREGKGKRNPALNYSLLKYVALWVCFLDVKGSSFTKKMETLFEIRKRAWNFYSNRRSTGSFDPGRWAPAPFRPPFWALLLVLVKTIPHLVDMLISSRSYGNLCEITQIVRRQSPGPSTVRRCLNCTIRNLSGSKTRAWTGCLTKLAEEVLTPRKVFSVVLPQRLQGETPESTT